MYPRCSDVGNKHKVYHLLCVADRKIGVSAVQRKIPMYKYKSDAGRQKNQCVLRSKGFLKLCPKNSHRKH